jgi:hypothetical protein
MFSNKLLSLGGFLLFLIGGIGIYNGYEEKQITKTNKIVLVDIIDCYRTARGDNFFKFSFKGEKFIKRTKYLFCERILGKEKVKMLTNKEGDKFIFFDELEVNNNFGYGLVLALIGLFIVYKGLRNK